jgi:cell wall-associated NlpC family hydrolase
MKRWLSIAVVAAGVAAHAAPPPTAEDDLQRVAAEKSLFGRLGQVRERITDTTSELVVTAMGFLGVPYRRGGNSAETGFDCSGFVKAIYEQTVGLVLPRRANEQAAATQTIPKQDLKPGDLVFFNTMRRAFSHVGIYVGDGKFIHSPKPGAEVRVEDMGVSYWARRFDGARRVVSLPPAPAPMPMMAAPMAVPVPMPVPAPAPVGPAFDPARPPAP